MERKAPYTAKTGICLSLLVIPNRTVWPVLYQCGGVSHQTELCTRCFNPIYTVCDQNRMEAYSDACFTF